MPPVMPGRLGLFVPNVAIPAICEKTVITLMRNSVKSSLALPARRVIGENTSKFIVALKYRNLKHVSAIGYQGTGL